MQKQSRKRKIAFITPPDTKGLRTPRPKKQNENGLHEWREETSSDFEGETSSEISRNSCECGAAEISRGLPFWQGINHLNCQCFRYLLKYFTETTFWWPFSAWIGMGTLSKFKCVHTNFHVWREIYCLPHKSMESKRDFRDFFSNSHIDDIVLGKISALCNDPLKIIINSLTL